MSFNKVNRVILISLLVRLLLIPYFADAFNYWSSSSFANFAINGYNPWIIMYNDPRYLELSLFGYPPPFLLVTILASLSYMFTKNMVVFLYTLKLPLVIADVVTLYLLCRITKHATNDESHTESVALLYALNPMPLIISVIWGTNDALAVVFTVAATYYFLKGNYPSSGFLLGIGSSFKIYPAYLVPAFFVTLRKRREMMQFILFFSLPIVIFSLPFLAWDANAYLSGNSAFRTKYLLSMASAFSYVFGGHYSNVAEVFSLIASIPLPIVLNLTLAFVMWRKKTPLLANILIMFLSVYVTSPYMWGNYFSWMVPFAVLASVDNALKKMRRSVLMLQLYWVPSFVYMLFVNGWYDSVGGSAGIFYWTYHWLHWQIVPWEYIGPNIVLMYVFVIAVNFVAGVVLIAVILKASQKIKMGNIRVNDESGRQHPVLSLATKHISVRRKSAILPAVLITLFLLQSFYTPTLSSKFSPIPSPALSPNIIFDDFNDSILNPQWEFHSVNGTYDILNDKPSFIQLRTSSGPLAAYLSRKTAPSQGTVEFRFKLERLSNDSGRMVLTRVEGGHLGVVANCSRGTVFYYQDENASIEETREKVYELSNFDDAWHVFRIDYVHDGRYIYFDNKQKYNITSPQTITFSYVFLGNPDSTGARGILSFDWVKINATNFPTGSQDVLRISAAILIPWVIVSLALAVITLQKLDIKFLIRKFGK